ncbi:uncharacterized protein TNCV_1223801 [Trichonephila clavipes]|nr:uncharacterized protein TNCV_1223801 [Trichonephila clavipes]
MGCGSPVVRVSDHGRYVMSSSPVPLKTRRVGPRCPLNLSRAGTSSRWCGVVDRRGGRVPAQVSSTSLDHGSKLRGPSPKALVNLEERSIEDYLDQLEGGWLSEYGHDDENSDDEYRDADEIRIIIIIIVFFNYHQE